MEPEIPPRPDNNRGGPPYDYGQLPVRRDEFDSLTRRIDELELKKSGKLLPWLGFCLGTLSFILNILLMFTPLSLLTYRKADIFLAGKGDIVTALFQPKSQTLLLTFDLTILNSGNRDGQLQAVSARLSDVNSTDAIYFDPEMRCNRPNQSPATVIIIPKGDTEEKLTCTLRYQLGDIGRPILSDSNPKQLIVSLKGDAKPLSAVYIINWDPAILRSGGGYKLHVR